MLGLAQSADRRHHAEFGMYAWCHQIGTLPRQRYAGQSRVETRTALQWAPPVLAGHVARAFLTVRRGHRDHPFHYDRPYRPVRRLPALPFGRRYHRVHPCRRAHSRPSPPWRQYRLCRQSLLSTELRGRLGPAGPAPRPLPPPLGPQPRWSIGPCACLPTGQAYCSQNHM